MSGLRARLRQVLDAARGRPALAPALIGHSHAGAVFEAAAQAGMPLRGFNFWTAPQPAMDPGRTAFHPEIAAVLSQGPVFSIVGGAAHNILAMVEHPRPFDFVLPERPDLPIADGAEVLPFEAMKAALAAPLQEYLDIIALVRRTASGPVFHIEAPPVPFDNDRILSDVPWMFFQDLTGAVAPPPLRWKVWRLQAMLTADFCGRMGVEVLHAPAESLDGQGYLRPEFYQDAMHVNAAYGALVLQQMRRVPMTHPYAGAAPHRLWRKAVGGAGFETDPVVDFPFRIAAEDKVCTAGSCFAQHISRRLQDGGFTFLVTESAHPILPAATAEAFNYGRFSARYGNLYTARQLLQLIRRAYGRFQPAEDIWETADGRFVDPFRPQIQPGGFATRREYELDRAQHFAAVRCAFETMDVFVFTLGLTESWEAARDGAVFPVCPGVAGGHFDPQAHLFRNQTVDEVTDDLRQAIAELRAVNPAVRVILTVSPVPLVATATEGHVLTATTYSKSVLRVAAGAVAAQTPDVAYFPSYEIVTGPQARGRYFAEDLRSMTEEGVDRVMTLFFRHAAIGPVPAAPADPPPQGDFVGRMRAVVDALCDEERLDAGD